MFTTSFECNFKEQSRSKRTCTISLMKKQFVVTHWYTVLQETKIGPILNRPALKHVMFFENIMTSSFLWAQFFE
jgi:hypothetical protein